MITLIIFLIILGIIVSIHEFGHFIMAKKNGIYVYEFSIGFGPKLFSFRRKNDETEYMVKLIPLGGYVALAGETYDEEEKDKIDESKKLYNKSFLGQLSVMVAGVFNNFVLGFVLLFIIGLIFGGSINTNKLYGMNKDSALYIKGARNNDIITRINGKKTNNFDDIQTQIAISGGKKALDITIQKNNTNKEVTYNVKPKYDKKTKNYYYGISVKNDIQKGFFGSLKFALYKFTSIYKSLIIIIISLFNGSLGLDNLSGPVGIYSVVGTVRSNIHALLYLTAYLSINVGFMNILPFPAFDGGRAFLLIIEKITGKKVPLKVETAINNIGFALLMILMVFVTIKDVTRLF